MGLHSFPRYHVDTVSYDTDLSLSVFPFPDQTHTCSFSSFHAHYRREEADLYAQERRLENERADKEEALCQQSEVAGCREIAHQ